MVWPRSARQRGVAAWQCQEPPSPAARRAPRVEGCTVSQAMIRAAMAGNGSHWPAETPCDIDSRLLVTVRPAQSAKWRRKERGVVDCTLLTPGVRKCPLALLARGRRALARDAFHESTHSTSRAGRGGAGTLDGHCAKMREGFKAGASHSLYSNARNPPRPPLSCNSSTTPSPWLRCTPPRPAGSSRPSTTP